LSAASPNTSPAELSKRVVLQYQTRTPDGKGAFTTTWNDAATVWAAVWPASAKEIIAAGAPSGVITHRVRIRFRKDITSAWRIKYGNRYLAIVAPPINPSMANQWLDVLCREAVL
jgi:SPP1 family predicted phage head-tail adaptor